MVVWGGDFRQTLPIEERATTAQTIAMCLHQWPLWTEHVSVMTLTENQRCMQLVATCTDVAERQRIVRWKNWLENLGDGSLADSDGRSSPSTSTRAVYRPGIGIVWRALRLPLYACR